MNQQQFQYLIVIFSQEKKSQIIDLFQLLTFENSMSLSTLIMKLTIFGTRLLIGQNKHHEDGIQGIVTK